MSANKFDNLVDRDDDVNTGATGCSNSNFDVSDVTDDTYTEEEQRDVNAITVTIPDRQTPIVVFFGSPASGKTLALMRMIRFLEGNGYQVVPEEVFRPKTDKHYSKMCVNLKKMVYDQYTPGGTDIISFTSVS